MKSSKLLPLLFFGVALIAFSDNTGSGASILPKNKVLTRQQAFNLARRFWPEKEVLRATLAMQRESSFNPMAHNQGGWVTDKETGEKRYIDEDSRGLFQLNIKGKTSLPGFPNWRKMDLFDPVANARLAHALWKLEGWNPWTTMKEYHT